MRGPVGDGVALFGPEAELVLTLAGPLGHGVLQRLERELAAIAFLPTAVIAVRVAAVAFLV